MTGAAARRVAFASALSLLAGCGIVLWSPYDYRENWLIREDPVRPFSMQADIIYMQCDMFENQANTSMMRSYAQSEVGKGKFNGFARVFSPLVATPEDLELALRWYFWHHHERGRPFVFIGEGEGGRILKAYEEEHAWMLKHRGLVASYYTEDARKGFVTPELVRKVKEDVSRAHFRSIWGREMPEGMLK